MKKLVVAVLLVAAWTPSRAAQDDPGGFPLADLSAVRVLGSFYIGESDGADGDLSYGGGAIGVSEDGRFLYWSCRVDQNGIAKLEIPAFDETATPVAPCQGPTRADIAPIHPDPNAWRPVLGGVLEQGGRMTVTAYITYDASGGTLASHWSGPSLTTLRGPFGGTVTPGLVKSQMAPVPTEWRALLGGPALSSAGYTSIISRASYGTSVSVFDPRNVTRNGFPMTLLLGCPYTIPGTDVQLEKCRDRYGAPTSNDYNGSELSGGFFIVPGTRTLVAIEREASGPTCYGYATRIQALHGTPWPSAARPDPTNVPWCYSLSDPLDEKGPKGYPYRLVAKLYDLAELVDVKQGRKDPWDVDQYATIDLPGSTPGEFVTSGAFNAARGEFYLLRGQGPAPSRIDVYGGFDRQAGRLRRPDDQ
jgi:hypothetical protein